MAIGEAELRFLIECYKRGVSFARTLMIGRQHLLVDRETVKRYMARIDIDCGIIRGMRYGGYADILFRNFSAEKVDSLDASGYEGPSILHDMNSEIPPELRSQYGTSTSTI